MRFGKSVAVSLDLSRYDFLKALYGSGHKLLRKRSIRDCIAGL